MYLIIYRKTESIFLAYSCKSPNKISNEKSKQPSKKAPGDGGSEEVLEGMEIPTHAVHICEESYKILPVRKIRPASFGFLLGSCVVVFTV